MVAFAIAAVAAGVGCKKKAVDPFPASGAVAGWEKTSDTRVFAAKELWQYIDMPGFMQQLGVSPPK